MRVALLLLAVVFGSMQTASAGTIGVHGERFNLNIINNFYNGQGHTSSILTGELDTNVLNQDLLWLVQPSNSYTAAEIAAMSTYLGTGGRIAFMGEHGSFAPNENNRITAAVAALGGNMSIVNSLVDSGRRLTQPGQILPDALTMGVAVYDYAAFAPLTLSGGAIPLMLGNQPAPFEDVMMGFENIGAGSIFLITDQNVWDNVAQSGNNDNGIMFLNLLQANTGAPPVNEVPEPTSLAIFGLLGLAALRQHRKSKRA